jgi:hypothetical protein
MRTKYDRLLFVNEKEKNIDSDYVIIIVADCNWENFQMIPVEEDSQNMIKEMLKDAKLIILLIISMVLIVSTILILHSRGVV